MRATILFTLAAIAAIGFAQSTATPVGRAVGEGIVAASNTSRAMFDFDVARRMSNTSTTPSLHGRFVFTQPGPSVTAAPHRRIVLNQLTSLAFQGNVANFGGPATMVVATATGPQTIHGRVHVTATDRVRPNQPITTPLRDSLHVRFFLNNSTTPSSAPVFEYGGPVVRGDIRVLLPAVAP